MKTLLAIAISAWIGWAGGALSDSVVPSFWGVWTFIGLVLILTTFTYIHVRRRV